MERRFLNVSATAGQFVIIAVGILNSPVKPPLPNSLCTCHQITIFTIGSYNPSEREHRSSNREAQILIFTCMKSQCISFYHKLKNPYWALPPTLTDSLTANPVPMVASLQCIHSVQTSILSTAVLFLAFTDEELESPLASTTASCSLTATAVAGLFVPFVCIALLTCPLSSCITPFFVLSHRNALTIVQVRRSHPEHPLFLP